MFLRKSERQTTGGGQRAAGAACLRKKIRGKNEFFRYFFKLPPLVGQRFLLKPIGF
jgi:hypothetical protein